MPFPTGINTATQFKKGQPAHPNAGRPKGAISVMARYQKFLNKSVGKDDDGNDLTRGERLYLRYLRLAESVLAKNESGEIPVDVANGLKAFIAVHNMTYGKPIEHIEFDNVTEPLDEKEILEDNARWYEETAKAITTTDELAEQARDIVSNI